MDIDQFKKKANVQEIPGGFGSTIKHYSMSTETLADHEKKFVNRADMKSEAWCTGSNSPKTNGKKGGGRKLTAKQWNHNKDAPNGEE